MPLDRAAALKAIYNAIDELNPQLKDGKRLEASEETILFGEGSRLDSLDLVNLIMAVEQHIAELSGEDVILASEAAMSRKRSPYRSVGSLADYAVEVAVGQAAA
jgi:acyl carrier protein